MKKIYFIVIALSIMGCNAQEKIIRSISCDDSIIVQYEKTSSKTKREGLEADKNLESFMVHFLNDFNHNIKGYVNGKLLFDEKVETDDVTSDAEKIFGYNYSKDDEVPTLKISLEENNKCFDIKIDKNYKIVYVFLTEKEEWIVRFSNSYYTH